MGILTGLGIRHGARLQWHGAVQLGRTGQKLQQGSNQCRQLRAGSTSWTFQITSCTPLPTALKRSCSAAPQSPVTATYEVIRCTLGLLQLFHYVFIVFSAISGSHVIAWGNFLLFTTFVIFVFYAIQGYLCAHISVFCASQQWCNFYFLLSNYYSTQKIRVNWCDDCISIFLECALPLRIEPPSFKSSCSPTACTFDNHVTQFGKPTAILFQWLNIQFVILFCLTAMAIHLTSLGYRTNSLLSSTVVGPSFEG